MLLMGLAGVLFCGLAIGFALGLLQHRTSDQLPKAVQGRILARLAAIGKPKRVRLRLVA